MAGEGEGGSNRCAEDLADAEDDDSDADDSGGGSDGSGGEGGLLSGSWSHWR